MDVSFFYPQRLFGIELCHGMIMLMELVRVGDVTLTACWLAFSWISREGTKDNLINVATEIRTRSPQSQTRIAAALTVPLGAKFYKYVQMTNE
jgi:hypothetical protein